MQRIVIGLVGEAGSGKGEIARFLIDQDFHYYSLSDTLRNISTAVGLTHDRETLISLGNALRENFGPDILAQGAKQWVETTGHEKVIIDSIRNPGEVSFLKEEIGAFIVGVTMSPEKTFSLMEARQRPGDPKTWEGFMALRRRERGDGEKSSGQQVEQCLALADIIVPNEGDIQDLGRHIQELLDERGIHPEWAMRRKEG